MSVQSYTVLRAGDRPHAELEIKRSRFLGYAARVETEEQARGFLAGIRRQHREARHVCHAFVLGPGRNTQRSSDDGEPSGTAGAPILNAIIARRTAGGLSDLSDVVVAVVRYFGGVKLGAGGLVQAYSETTAATLDAGRFVVRQRLRQLHLTLPITDAARVESALRAAGERLAPTEYRAGDAVLTLEAPDNPADVESAGQRLAAASAGAEVSTSEVTRWAP